MAVALLLFVLPSERPSLDHIIRALGKSESGSSKKPGRLMDWPTMQRLFPWNVVLLLGGGFALAAGVKESGLSHVIGDALSRVDSLPVWAIILTCLVITMAVTNICSNTVTASIFIPIVASLSQQAELHPLTLMLPTTIACSFAFMLPVGTPPNAIVFASGALRVKDMIASGMLVTIATSLITVAYMGTVAPLVFDLAEQPPWALPNATAF
ncbi:Protein NAC-3 b [Aphelenchoides avenae]|nr:Protein NAC-3 b [Aphelenchus avenae]